MNSKIVARMVAYVPAVLFVVVVPLADYFPSILDGVKINHLMTLVVLSTLGIGIHLEARFSEELGGIVGLRKELATLRQEQKERLDHIGRSVVSTTFSEAFERQALLKNHVETLRVFAISSAQIVSFMNIRKLTVEKCYLLLRGFDEHDTIHREFNAQIQLAIRDWQRLTKEGKIHSLEIRSYDFLPTEYQVIFDSDSMISGLYDSDPTDYSEVKVREPVLVDGSTIDGRTLIAKYIARFDILFQQCDGNHGPNRYKTMSISQGT